MFEIIIKILKDVVFPKQCFRCKVWGDYICLNCRDTLQPQTNQRCIVCQKPSLGGWTHPKCQNSFTPNRLVTIFDYHDPTISKLINTAKLSLVPEIFLELANAACDRLSIQSASWDKFVLCPIPQTNSKTRWRGFNHTELIAKQIEKQYKHSIDRVLIKSRNTKQQKELNKTDRALNLQQAFHISQPEYLPQQILLVDDITTTGSTFMEATKTLKKAKVKIVWCIAIAQD